MASEASGLPVRRVRHNYLAILIAGIANFLLEAGWYSSFYTTWLNGIGRTDEWLRANSPNRALQYATAMLAAMVIAAGLSWVIQLTGPQTAIRGITAGFMVWLCFVATTWATEYIFEVRPLSLYAVNAGFWLVGMVLMGAIVGGWKAKAAHV